MQDRRWVIARIGLLGFVAMLGTTASLTSGSPPAMASHPEKIVIYAAEDEKTPHRQNVH